FDRVAPAQARAAERFDAAQVGQVAAAELDALEPRVGERRLPELAVLEQHILELRAGELALAEAAVPEDDVLQARLPELGAGEPAAGEGRALRGEAERLDVRPVGVDDRRVDEVVRELADRLGVVLGIGRIRLAGRLAHPASIGQSKSAAASFSARRSASARSTAFTTARSDAVTMLGWRPTPQTRSPSTSASM